MEVLETILLVCLYLFWIVVFVLFFWKIVPLLYRALVAQIKILERKVDKIDDDDKTITLI